MRRISRLQATHLARLAPPSAHYRVGAVLRLSFGLGREQFVTTQGIVVHSMPSIRMGIQFTGSSLNPEMIKGIVYPDKDPWSEPRM